MAAPITHLLFAAALSEEVSNEFMAGVSFPDIRYISSLSRERTHAFGVDKITDVTSFISGMAFHQYIDVTREEYWEEHGIYNKLPVTPSTVSALKFCEDVVLYDLYDKWQSLATTFQGIRTAPLLFQNEVSDEEMQHWYGLLADYVTQKPSTNKMAHMLRQMGLEEENIAKTEEIAQQILQDEAAVLAIRQYYVNMCRKLENLI